jgi:hypothetical protein
MFKVSYKRYGISDSSKSFHKSTVSNEVAQVVKESSIQGVNSVDVNVAETLTNTGGVILSNKENGVSIKAKEYNMVDVKNYSITKEKGVSVNLAGDFDSNIKFKKTNTTTSWDNKATIGSGTLKNEKGEVVNVEVNRDLNNTQTEKKTYTDSSIDATIYLNEDSSGKIWALPNTAIGLGYGFAGVIYSLLPGKPNVEINIDNNAIQFIGHPFGKEGSAITLGNTILYFPKIHPDDVWRSSVYTGKDFAPLIVGSHEQTHTYQQQKWGVGFFIPYFATGGFWDGKGLNGKNPSFFEVEADRNGHIAYCNKYNKC